jgi:Family of unknown function (DUF6495)
MLTPDELSVFEEEFKHFLIVNGVDNDEWIEMNKSNVEKATQLVELFSDTVLQKVYEKISFIEHRSEKSCMVFRLGTEHIELISINSIEGFGIDLSTPESIHEALSKNASQLTMFKTKKDYSKDRELEIHDMIEQGCVQSSEEFWALLDKVLS